MGRLDLNDKQVDWVAVSRRGWAEKCDQLARLEADVEELEDRVGTLQAELVRERGLNGDSRRRLLFETR